MTNGSGPSSWRDVYDLVRDARLDILTEVHDGFAQAKQQLADHSARIDVLEDERANRASIRLAVRGTLTNGRLLLIMLLSAASLIISLLKP